MTNISQGKAFNSFYNICLLIDNIFSLSKQKIQKNCFVANLLILHYFAIQFLSSPLFLVEFECRLYRWKEERKLNLLAGIDFKFDQRGICKNIIKIIFEKKK